MILFNCQATSEEYVFLGGQLVITVTEAMNMAIPLQQNTKES